MCLILIIPFSFVKKESPNMGTKTVFPAFVGKLVSTTSEKRIPKHGDENASGTTTNAVVVFPAVKKESPNRGTKTV